MHICKEHSVQREGNVKKCPLHGHEPPSASHTPRRWATSKPSHPRQETSLRAPNPAELLEEVLWNLEATQDMPLEMRCPRMSNTPRGWPRDAPSSRNSLTSRDVSSTWTRAPSTTVVIVPEKQSSGGKGGQSRAKFTPASARGFWSSLQTFNLSASLDDYSHMDTREQAGAYLTDVRR